MARRKSAMITQSHARGKGGMGRRDQWCPQDGWVQFHGISFFRNDNLSKIQDEKNTRATTKSDSLSNIMQTEWFPLTSHNNDAWKVLDGRKRMKERKKKKFDKLPKIFQRKNERNLTARQKVYLNTVFPNLLSKPPKQPKEHHKKVISVQCVSFRFGRYSGFLVKFAWKEEHWVACLPFSFFLPNCHLICQIATTTTQPTVKSSLGCQEILPPPSPIFG